METMPQSEEFFWEEDEAAAMQRKAWRYSLAAIGVCVALFALLWLPGLLMRFAPKPTGAGQYQKILGLTPGEELLKQYGPAFFPNNRFTNLKGDYQVACQKTCYQDEYFIGIQSHLLYHGLTNVASGKPERPATNEDLIR